MKELKDYTTKELTEELIKRGGVDTIHVEPYESYTISLNNKEIIHSIGQATILVNID